MQLYYVHFDQLISSFLLVNCQQKCRNDDWRVPEERKLPTTSFSTAAGSVQKSQTRRFGAMPRLAGSSLRHGSPTRQHQENTKSAESPSSPSINGVMGVESSHQPLQSSQYLTVRSPGPSSPQSVAQPVRSADGTAGKSQIVGSINYRSGDLRVNSREMDVRSADGNNCGVFNSLIRNFPIGEKYGFSDDPRNISAGIDCYATTTHPPPLYHRRVISDEVFGLPNLDRQYPFQCFSDHYARLGGDQAESSSRFDTGFNVRQLKKQ
ncbi:unnamed protein product [Cuscuta epithymum]|uniref:Uncharacterized protein n=1 Tax=Cuscuta epithymum TaxID=186058 RepID=A0AAV0FLQ2_9ASTE|nr:unnamed protein product [Cuscuta epithymum]CAH9136501.1 unnamed protein product [Cuscuta epithymum]